MRILIIGATSAIAVETARAYAASGARFCLLARDPERLAAVRDDLLVRGAAEADTVPLDVTDYQRHEAVIATAWEKLGGVDVALLAHGVLPDQQRCEDQPAKAVAALAVNATATIALLLPLAARFEAQRSGTIALIGSVAGDRGRATNWVYGAGKAAVERAADGLRQRLSRAGVAVVLIKPGFVSTPMTAHLPQGPLFASPRQVGRDIRRAIDRRRPVVYTPWFWRPIMAIIRLIPRPMFNRLRF